MTHIAPPQALAPVKSSEFISLILIPEVALDFSPQVEALARGLETHYQDFEIIVIEKTPLSLPRPLVELVLNQNAGIRFLELSYKVDFEIAVTLGLESAIGDYVVVFDPAHDPFEAIAAMLAVCRQGIDIVVGVGTNIGKSLGYRLIRPLVKSTLKEIGYVIPQNATTLRCLSRSAVNAVTQVQNFHQQLFVRMSQCGLKTDIYTYALLSPNDYRKTVTKAIQDSMILLIFNTTKPLHWMSLLGFVGSFVALIVATYSFVIRLIQDNVASGWTSLMILMSFLFMILFIILSFFGEYMNRIISEQGRNKPYWVVNERHSNIMIDIDRRNILD